MSALVRFQLPRRPAHRFVQSLILCATARAMAAVYLFLLERHGTTLIARVSVASDLIGTLNGRCIDLCLHPRAPYASLATVILRVTLPSGHEAEFHYHAALRHLQGEGRACL